MEPLGKRPFEGHSSCKFQPCPSSHNFRPRLFSCFELPTMSAISVVLSSPSRLCRLPLSSLPVFPSVLPVSSSSLPVFLSSLPFRRLQSPFPACGRVKKRCGAIEAVKGDERIEGIPYLGLTSWSHDILCTMGVVLGAALWVRVFDLLVENNCLDQKLSRKLIHISTGILFVLAWPIFSQSPLSRACAAIVPVSNMLRLLLYGYGILKDEGFVKSISREGTPVELLRGPLYYVSALSFCGLVFWRDSPVGMIALAMMCGGDGIADIVGRRIGGNLRLPYNTKKSWAGSISMFVFGFLLSIGFLYYYTALGFLQIDMGKAVSSIAIISLVATIVESLPITSYIDDNISVPLTAILVGLALLPNFT